jgi:hypothetical protein
MKKQFWVTFFSILILSTSLSHAQWRIITAGGEEYTGVFISQEKDSIRIRTLDNIDVSICQDSIIISDKIKTKIETKSKDVFIGYVNNINEKELQIVTEEFGEISIQRADIIKTESFNDEYKLPGVLIGTYTEPKNIYPSFGITIGYPRNYALVFAYTINDWGCRLTADPDFYNSNYFFYRFNLIKNISKSEHFEHNFSIAIGYDYFGERTKTTGTWSVEYDPKTGMYTIHYDSYSEKREYFVDYYGIYYDINFYGLFLELGAIYSTSFPPKWSFMSVDDLEPRSTILISVSLGYVYRFN